MVSHPGHSDDCCISKPAVMIASISIATQMTVVASHGCHVKNHSVSIISKPCLCRFFGPCAVENALQHGFAIVDGVQKRRLQGMLQWRGLPAEITQRHSPSSQHGRSTESAIFRHPQTSLSNRLIPPPLARLDKKKKNSRARLQRVFRGFSTVRPPRARALLSKGIVGGIAARLAVLDQHELDLAISVVLMLLTYCWLGEISHMARQTDPPTSPVNVPTFGLENRDRPAEHWLRRLSSGSVRRRQWMTP